MQIDSNSLEQGGTLNDADSLALTEADWRARTLTGWHSLKRIEARHRSGLAVAPAKADWLAPNDARLTRA